MNSDSTGKVPGDDVGASPGGVGAAETPTEGRALAGDAVDQEAAAFRSGRGIDDGQEATRAIRWVRPCMVSP